ncbi:MAG TPA: hypothetical protein DDW17_02080 [Deltaproteobacteria bacterium]|nr:hypothetical protein [Deltaproteobacteria bacterium]
MKEIQKNSLEWVREVGIEDLLDGDLKLVYEWCGLDTLLTLLTHFPSMSLYISTKPLTEAKKRYIRKHYNRKNIKELCSLLEVSERFIYDAVSDLSPVEARQDKLF